MSKKLTTGVIFAVIPLLMLVTRMDHFGSAISLPDASLAVFFLAGFYLCRAAVFLLFCTLAAGIDYWAITTQGVSDFCVTPAYGFLLPTYFIVWWAGRWARRQDYSGRQFNRKVEQFRLVGVVWLALSAAFVVSNGGFYLFSGYFTELGSGEYLGRVGRYYMPYMLSPLGYLAVGVLFHGLLVGSKNTRLSGAL